MDYTYRFEDHLREHRPSRLGQRLWWLPAAAGVGVVIGDVLYMKGTSSAQLSAVAAALPFIAALLFLVAWAALSVADWTYAPEKHYREAQHAAASQALAYILAWRRARGEHTATPIGAGFDGDHLNAGIADVVHTHPNQGDTMLVVERWTPTNGLQTIEGA